MNYITIIPARGGSKRFPGKIVHDFMGKPLIAHSIETSNECSLVSRTFVSMEDKHIKQVSLSYGAEIFDRPTLLGRDYSTSAEEMQNAVWILALGGNLITSFCYRQQIHEVRKNY